MFIPESGETITAHPDFLVFATQNPASGAYGGRKLLSRAFRNRFIEAFIDEIPTNELDIILQSQCLLASSFIRSMLNVYGELKSKRLKSSIFESSSSFMTIRDLLKWGHRAPETREELALEGYYLIAERLRDEQEKEALKKLLEEKCLQGKNQKINIDFRSDPVVMRIQGELQERGLTGELYLTDPMARLVGLVGRCIQHNEPVLLVGETGAGKTTLCQALSKLSGKKLRMVNCHQHTETADLLGSIRPVKAHNGSFYQCEIIGTEITGALENREQYVFMRLMEDDGRKEKIRNCVALIKEAVKEVKKSREATISIEEEKVETTSGQATSVMSCPSLDISALQIAGEMLKEYLKEVIREIRSTKEVKLEKRNESNTIKRVSETGDEEKVVKQRRVVKRTDVKLSGGQQSGGRKCTMKGDSMSANEIANGMIRESEIFVAETIKLIDRFNRELQSTMKFFEWNDGPLVRCMKSGDYFLLDEISLADDAILERLNSVLEPERVLVLAEKGGGLATPISDGRDDPSLHTSVEVIYADPSFQVFATMNPGGDFGKRELSPALRNRFTEIWVPAIRFNSLDTLQLIYRQLLTRTEPISKKLDITTQPQSVELLLSRGIQNSVCWFNALVKHPLSVREVLAWTTFLKSFVQKNSNTTEMLMLGFVHGESSNMLRGFTHGFHLPFC